MPNVTHKPFMLIVGMLIVGMLSVIMLSVAARLFYLANFAER